MEFTKQRRMGGEMLVRMSENGKHLRVEDVINFRVFQCSTDNTFEKYFDSYNIEVFFAETDWKISFTNDPTNLADKELAIFTLESFDSPQLKFDMVQRVMREQRLELYFTNSRLATHSNNLASLETEIAWLKKWDNEKDAKIAQLRTVVLLMWFALVFMYVMLV